VDSLKTVGFVLCVTVLIIAALLFVPWITLWSLNTISEQSGMGWRIPHNFWTYIATLILAMLANGRGAKK
jgi:hypothetical protein